jgi:5'-methylthioadenosine phosphorylase
VDVASVVAVAQENAARAAQLVARVARDFPAEREPCPAKSDRALDGAIMTAPSLRNPVLLAKLDAVAGRVLKANG